MSTPKEARQYATETLDDIEELFQFIDFGGSKIRGSKADLADMFPAVYVNSDTHRGEMELLQGDEIISDFWPFDHSVLFAPRSGGHLNGYRMRSVARKEAAGRVKMSAPRMLRLDFLVAAPGAAAVAPSYFGIFPGNAIRDISIRSLGRLDMVRPIMSACVTSFYDWHVVIGRAGSPIKVKLPATPTSAREFLSLRDVPEGMQRRAAIKHWVSEHQRRRLTPEQYDVSAHLRGRVDFTWGDYEGWVEPSGHDFKKVGK